MEKQKMENENTQQGAPVVLWAVEESPKEQYTKTCCCCIPINIACFTLGYLALVFNVYNTLSTVGSLTLLGLLSHGFSYLQTKELEDGVVVPAYDEDEKTILSGMAIGMTVVLLLNFAWLLVNIYLLVGLHKKRPGYIRVNITIAAIRFVVMIFSLASLDGSYDYKSLAMICFELGLTGYFIILYYVYANQLDKEIAEKSHVVTPAVNHDIPIISVTEHFAYPKYLDKQHLVEKEKF